MKIIKTEEAAPASRPMGDVAEATWLRFEAWCRKYRWGVREVVWTAQGAGDFRPPILPATLTKSEYWTGTAWAQEDPKPEPWGYCWPQGVWRLTYQVGAETAREDVLEAARRYEDYLAEVQGMAGASSIRDGDYAVTRSQNAVARALELSGAADLLREYR